MIPAQAVEAAAKGIFDVRDDPYDLDEWEDLDSIAREPYICHARAALEAAAPHMPTTPATVAMGGILETLDQWFNNKTSPDQALNAIAQISGQYKNEEGL